jgi:polyisoprenoid-binding protein YceI
MTRIAWPLAALVLIAGCSRGGDAANNTATNGVEAPPATAAAPETKAPAGRYEMDLSHTSVNFKVDHLGLSAFVARFTKMDGELNFDPKAPEAMTVSVNIDPSSVQTNYPDPATVDFDKEVEDKFLEVEKFPTMTFRSTKVETTGPSTARVTGDLTLHGVTKPVVLETTFNGGYPAGGMDPVNARIGFSAKGSFKRSDFGIGYGVPAAGSKMGVSDEVKVEIEAEFIQPGAQAAAAQPAG